MKKILIGLGVLISTAAFAGDLSPTAQANLLAPQSTPVQSYQSAGSSNGNGAGAITAANAADGQAMQDSADALWSALLAGSNQVWHAAGWLEGGLTMGYEKFVMDLDHCGMMMRQPCFVPAAIRMCVLFATLRQSSRQHGLERAAGASNSGTSF